MIDTPGSTKPQILNPKRTEWMGWMRLLLFRQPLLIAGMARDVTRQSWRRLTTTRNPIATLSGWRY